MWQSPTPVLTADGRELTELNAWVYRFARAWEALEQDPEDLCMQGFYAFGPAVAEKHGHEDPELVAQRLYPEAGEFMEDLYPGFQIPPSPAVAPLEDGDVPF